MLQLFCPIGYTGYGYASLNILKAMSSIIGKEKISLSLIGQPHLDNQYDADIVKKCLDNQLSMKYDDASLKIWHQFDLIQRVGSGKYLAYPFFELNKLSARDKYHLNFPDNIIVSCEWARNILLDNQINKPINIAPLGVDTTIFYPRETPQTKNYVFCTIGKWEKRKSHDTIIECFNKAFKINDNVELWLLTHNSFLNSKEEQTWVNIVQQSKLNSKIKIFPRLSSHMEVAEIISYSNCGVYISRGEGWNMELLETMAMNKPVIVSNFSAHTEYCNSANSYLVNIDELELAIDDKWFFGENNACWAKLGQSQIDQTIEHMRYLYNNRVIDNPEGLKTAQNYTWNNTSQKILDLI